LYTKLTRKRQEIFFNQTLAFDEIDRLFDAKAFSKFSRYTADGKQAVGEITSRWRNQTTFRRHTRRKSHYQRQ
ncbi:TPA: hypothetical protein ACLA39_001036, partial [Neisseria meningitidis]